MTPFDLNVEYWAHYYTDNKIVDEVEDEDFDKDAILAQFAAEAGDDEWEEVDLSNEQ